LPHVETVLVTVTVNADDVTPFTGRLGTAEIAALDDDERVDVVMDPPTGGTLFDGVEIILTGVDRALVGVETGLPVEETTLDEVVRLLTVEEAALTGGGPVYEE